MPRNLPDFKASALFHGTAHPFEIGDVITPQEGSQYAYATPNFEYARGRALDSIGYAWNDFSRNNATAYADWEKTTPPRVYEVEPTDDVEPDEQGNVRSKSGFRVVRKVHG